MIKYLEKRVLVEPHTYVGYNGETKTVSQYNEIPVRIKGIKFMFLFFIKTNYEIEISLLLGINFFENFSPCHIKDREISITIDRIKKTISKYA